MVRIHTIHCTSAAAGDGKIVRDCLLITYIHLYQRHSVGLDKEGMIQEEQKRTWRGYEKT